jgi:hypothetical protein
MMGRNPFCHQSLRIAGRYGLLVALLAALCGLPAVSQGATGGLISLPLPKVRKPGPPPKPNPRAMTVTLDTTWVECTAYRPVRVTITPTPPLTSNRTVTIFFRPSHWSGEPLATVSQDVEVPANAASVSAMLSVPQMEPWTTFSLDVYDDGVPVEELSVPRHTTNFATANNLWGDGASPNILFLGSTKDPTPLFGRFYRTNESAIQMQLGPAAYSSGVVGATTVVNQKFAGVSGILSHAALPTRWLDYSGLDIIYASLPELKDLIDKHPQQWQAMRAWLGAGGNLWITDCGTRWQRLPELVELLDLPQFEQVDTGEGPLSGWSKPNASLRDQEILGASRQYGGAVMPNPMPQTMPGDESDALTTAADPRDRGRMPVPFVMRTFGLGQVVAFSDRDPLAPQSGIQWPWVFNSVTPDRWQWYLRHGVSLHRDNQDFWDFLIPGVGLAPVTQFQVLITLFVVVIGPVNFLLLRRWHKLNLLVITVPASALTITLCLFVYALLADGLGVRVRARSFTALDQQRGEAVCWGRLSYYAGISPSQGLAFPLDTAVYPLADKPQGAQHRTNRRTRETDWGAKQYLGRGWLAARTPTQLVTLSTRKSNRQLVVHESAAAPPKIDNRLGAEIAQLVLVDSGGNFFEAAGPLAAGASAPLEASNSVRGGVNLTAQLSKNRPELPIGFSHHSYGLFGMRSTSYYNAYGTDLTEPTRSRSLLEKELLKHCSTKIENLPPRSYVAVLATSPELSLGIESAREEASFHVLVGKW